MAALRAQNIEYGNDWGWRSAVHHSDVRQRQDRSWLNTTRTRWNLRRNQEMRYKINGFYDKTQNNRYYNNAKLINLGTRNRITSRSSAWAHDVPDNVTLCGRVITDTRRRYWVIFTAHQQIFERIHLQGSSYILYDKESDIQIHLRCI